MVPEDCRGEVFLKGSLFCWLCLLHMEFVEGKMREECSSGSDLPSEAGGCFNPCPGTSQRTKSSVVNKWTGNCSSHPWLSMPFANFLHSSLQIFTEIVYFFKIEKEEMAQFPSTITFE